MPFLNMNNEIYTPSRRFHNVKNQKAIFIPLLNLDKQSNSKRIILRDGWYIANEPYIYPQLKHNIFVL